MTLDIKKDKKEVNMKNLEILKIRGEQLADQEAIGQLFDQVKALYDYLGLTYIHIAKKAIKID